MPTGNKIKASRLFLAVREQMIRTKRLVSVVTGGHLSGECEEERLRDAKKMCTRSKKKQSLKGV